MDLWPAQGRQGDKEDELTLCAVDSVGLRSRVSFNAVVGRKPRWDRLTRSVGEPQRGGGQESGVGYSDRGPEGDPGCHQFGLGKKAMAARQGLSSIFSWRCNTSNQVNIPLSTLTQVNTVDIEHQKSAI